VSGSFGQSPDGLMCTHAYPFGSVMDVRVAVGSGAAAGLGLAVATLTMTMSTIRATNAPPMMSRVLRTRCHLRGGG
jgi:hypothetical protein